MARTGETARDFGIGVLILVDELQEANTEDLVAINTALHHLGQGEVPLPLMLVGAGLPSLPAQLADATSYAERLYDYRPVGLLDDQAAVDAAQPSALTQPVKLVRIPFGPNGCAVLMHGDQPIIGSPDAKLQRLLDLPRLTRP